ncbi:hypothetical protein OUZ56_018922 [Daphnia magna]|uniref:Uncharacterized protein n=1 Tax=Daphnia magna TaxID=35525 RepID=A0ABQ9ZAV6_9CRUS|nr:hypothetical protein OUZ56_018922 [Daphnia magna]
MVKRKNVFNSELNSNHEKQSVLIILSHSFFSNAIETVECNQSIYDCRDSRATTAQPYRELPITLHWDIAHWDSRNFGLNDGDGVWTESHENVKKSGREITFQGGASCVAWTESLITVPVQLYNRLANKEPARSDSNAELYFHCKQHYERAIRFYISTSSKFE